MGETPEEIGLITDLQWRIEVNGFMAMVEFLRNSTQSMKKCALAGTYDYEQIPALAEREKLRLQRFLKGVDQMVDDKAYLTAENFSVADIDLLVLVEFAGWRKLALPSTSKNALRWYQQIRERSSVKL